MVVQVITQAATVASGIVSILALLSVVADAVTQGWVRTKIQAYLGIRALREDHHATQTFITDLAGAYNGLADSVAENNDIPDHNRPDEVDVDQYERLLDDETDVERGDFVRGSDD